MKRKSLRRHGVALISVLWLVAAMSLIISGVVRSVRGEAKSASDSRQAMLAGAKADAAILLALQRLHSQKAESKPNLQNLAVTFEGLNYNVLVMPLNGLVDINQAPVGLLTSLYQFVAGVTPDEARILAQATVERRQLKDVKGQQRGFESVSDLMTVPGMSYELYAKVSPLITADIKSGSGRVNLLAAPMALLVALASGDINRATQFLAQRSVDSNVVDATFFNPEFTEMTASTSLRLEADVALSEGGAIIQKVWHIYWARDERSGLPWRVLDVSQSRRAKHFQGSSQ